MQVVPSLRGSYERVMHDAAAALGVGAFALDLREADLRSALEVRRARAPRGRAPASRRRVVRSARVLGGRLSGARARARRARCWSAPSASCTAPRRSARRTTSRRARTRALASPGGVLARRRPRCVTGGLRAGAHIAQAPTYARARARTAARPQARLPAQFDLLVHYNTTTALRPLDPGTAWAALAAEAPGGDMPETWPVGV